MMWLFQVNLDGNYRQSKWQSQEGAIADRERQLRPHTIKDASSPTGKRTIRPIGWTAIRRIREGERT